MSVLNATAFSKIFCFRNLILKATNIGFSNGTYCEIK